MAFHRNGPGPSPVFPGVLLATLIPFIASAAFAATPQEINSAIDRAKEFLYTRQQSTGQWERDLKRNGTFHDFGGMQGDTFGGYTAIATYALLSAGEPKSDPRIVKALEFLEDADVIGIYALGLRANVWPYVGGKKAKILSDREAHLILSGMQTGKENPATKGFWDYGNGRGFSGTGSGRFDHSVSQYGVLGLWASALNDVPIDSGIWKMIDVGWKTHQYPDGGWCYDTVPPRQAEESVSMTAAGVATLFITEEMLYPNRGLDCSGNSGNENIERGMKYIIQHYHQVDNNYSFYAIERIGAASGHKYLGSIDWYRDGAEKLLRTQLKDGSWIDRYGGGDNPVPTTAFALLFLARGREPVMMNKLQYHVTLRQADGPVEGNWNQRSRDVPNLVHWTSHQLERGLNWQIVNLKSSIDDLHDAPILYISGDQELIVTPDDEAKLREFVETGGMILANADCGATRKSFADSFEALGHRLFPRYSFRELPAGHLIFTNQPYPASRWKSPQILRGLSNGVREMMILVPDADPARAWQTRSPDLLASFQLGADIFLYAVDKQNLTNKGENYIVRPDLNIMGRRSTKIARLIVGDNSDPEPGGWRRLAALIHNRFQFDVDTKPVKLGIQKLTGCRVAHLTGTGPFNLPLAQRQELVDFVQAGGTLVIDAAGGDAAFAESAMTVLKAGFGTAAFDALNQPLDLSHPVFNLPDAVITGATYRDLYRRHGVGNLKTPRLVGIPVGNRIGVFFSREDLSAGMVGEPVDGIAGYTPQSATEIMRNIILYSAFNVRPGSGR